MNSFLCNYLQKQKERNKLLFLMYFLLGIFSASTVQAQIYARTLSNPNLYYYDINNNTWTFKTPPTSLGITGYQSMVYMNGVLYLTESLANTGVLPRLFVYIPSTDQWVRLLYSTNLYAPAACSVPNMGKIYYYDSVPNAYVYDPITNTLQLASPFNSVNSFDGAFSLVYDGNNYIYGHTGVISNTSMNITRFNIATGVHDKLLVNQTVIVPRCFAYLNDQLYYSALGKGLYKYNPATNTVSVVSSTLNGQNLMTTDGQNLYLSNSLSSGLVQYMYKFDLTTNTWTKLATPPAVMQDLISTEACAMQGSVSAISASCNGITANNNAQLLVNSYSGVTKVGYSLGSTYTGPDYSTATTLGTAPFAITNTLPNPPASKAYTVRLFNSVNCYVDTLVTLQPSVPPIVTASAISATCAGLVVNSNGKLVLNTFTGASKKYGYSIGETYTGAAFSTATPLGSTVPFTIVNNLANPAAEQLYTIRVFNSATCYKDMGVILPTQICASADLGITVSPSSLTKNSGETETYSITVTNNGPSTATNAIVKVPIPQGRKFLTAQVSQGSYDSNTQQWTIGILPNGSNATMDFSIAVN